MARGVDPTMLLGLKSKDKEVDEFAVREDDEEEEQVEVEEAIPRRREGNSYNICTQWNFVCELVC